MATLSDSKSILHFRIMLTAEGEGVFLARVLDSPAGATTQPVRFSLSQLPRELRALDRNALPDPVRVRSWGEALYAALFTGDIHTKLETALALLDERKAVGAMLQISLDCGEAPTAAALPWEALWSPQRKALALYPGVTIVRQVKRSNTSAPLTGGALRVLVISADPQTLRQVNATEEWARVNGALSALEREGAVQLIHLENASFAALHKLLETMPIDVLHYIGHGAYDEEFQEGYLAFENERGEAQRITGLQLAQMIANLSTCRLVVLNACVSAQGVGQELADHRAPLVVGMQFPITDGAAASFAESFYRALAQGRTVSEAVDRGRMAIYAQPNEAEWIAPVVFVDAAEPSALIVGAPKTQGIIAADVGELLPPWPKPRLRLFWAALGFIGVLMFGYLGLRLFMGELVKPDLNESAANSIDEPAMTLAELPTLPESPVITPTATSEQVLVAAQVLTTTALITATADCGSIAQGLAAELTKQVKDWHPAVTVALSAPADDQATRIDALPPFDLILWCERIDGIALHHFEIRSQRGAVEAFEPKSFVLQSLSSDQLLRVSLAFVQYVRRSYGDSAKGFQLTSMISTDAGFDAPMQLMAGNAYLFDRQYQQAKDAFMQTTDLAASWAGAWHNLGLVEMIMGWERNDFANAQAHFERAMELDPELGLPALALARIDRWLAFAPGAGNLVDTADLLCESAKRSPLASTQNQATICHVRVAIVRYSIGLSEVPPTLDNEAIRQMATSFWSEPFFVLGLRDFLLWNEYRDKVAGANAIEYLTHYKALAEDDLHLSSGLTADYSAATRYLDLLEKGKDTPPR